MKSIIKKLLREGLLESNNNDCNFFDLRTTGMDYYDGIIRGNGNQYKHPSSNVSVNNDNPIKFILKYMSKEDYGKIIKRTLTDPNYIQDKKIVKIMDEMQNGVKYHTPMVDLADNYNFQEGRHRVIAASNLGCKLIPVYIFGVEAQLKF